MDTIAPLLAALVALLEAIRKFHVNIKTPWFLKRIRMYFWRKKHPAIAYFPELGERLKYTDFYKRLEKLRRK